MFDFDANNLLSKMTSPALLVAALTWTGRQLAEYRRRRREERAPIGRVLADLLEIRHNFRALEYVVKAMSARVPLTPLDEVALKRIVVSFLPTSEGLAARYEDALKQIAANDPVTAFALKSAPQIHPFLHSLRSLIAANRTAGNVLAQFEPEVVKVMQETLDNLVVAIARQHGWVTWWRVRRRLKGSAKPIPDIDAMLDKMIGDVNRLSSEIALRKAKAEADLRTLASAVSLYAAHCAMLPSTLPELTKTATNKVGVRAGPFLGSVPSPPTDWEAYVYVPKPDGSFAISTSGDGMSANIP